MWGIAPDFVAIFGEGVEASASCHEYSSTRTAVVRSPWLARPSVTHSAAICAIQISASLASGRLYKLTEDASVSEVLGAPSALQTLCNNAPL